MTEVPNANSCWKLGGHKCVHLPSGTEIMTGLWRNIESWIPQTAMQQFRLKSLATFPIVVSALAANSTLENRPFDVFRYVDPLIGTINGGMLDNVVSKEMQLTVSGHVFPGATLPFGTSLTSIELEYC